MKPISGVCVMSIVAALFWIENLVSDPVLAKNEPPAIVDPLRKDDAITEADRHFVVFQNGVKLKSFAEFTEAYGYANLYADSLIKVKGFPNQIAWKREDTIPSSVSPLDVPLIYQMPELPRGCEVTSLTMLLNYYGAGTDKLMLAEQIRKDPTPYSRNQAGQVYFGHPNNGFVGDMYTFLKPGYGVYHRPVYDLANQYFPGQIVDLTGADFNVVKQYLAKGSPVWIVTNTEYRPLGEGSFGIWRTSQGPVRITYSEHSVLLTGYDEKYVYFNDPLGSRTRGEAYGFEQAWEQMGRQAVAIMPYEWK